MRLSWIDPGCAKVKDFTVKQCKEWRDLGFGVAGFNTTDFDASDADIKRAKKIYEDCGMMPGSPGVGAGLVRPDENEEKEHLKIIAKGLIFSGKLGGPTLRIAAGSFNKDNPWAKHPDNHTQKAMDRLVKNTMELAKIAEDSNTILCPETTQWTIIGTIERMKEFVDRVDSPCVKINLDVVNHITNERVYESGKFVKCAVAYLGDRIGTIHCKDVKVDPIKLLVCHIDETIIGTGLLDHAAVLEASTMLEPWKCLEIEHVPQPWPENIKKSIDHIQAVAQKIGHKWDDPKLTRDKWLSLKNKADKK